LSRGGKGESHREEKDNTDIVRKKTPRVRRQCHVVRTSGSFIIQRFVRFNCVIKAGGSKDMFELLLSCHSLTLACHKSLVTVWMFIRHVTKVRQIWELA
jgi:hypothetical protein